MRVVMNHGPKNSPGRPGFTPIGESLRIPLKNGHKVSILTPKGRRIESTSKGGIALVPIPTEPGIFRAEIEHLEASGNGNVIKKNLYGLRNLLNQEESNLEQRGTLAYQGTRIESIERNQLNNKENWKYLLSLLILVLLLEIFLTTPRTA